MIEIIKRLIFAFQFKRAVKRAKENRELTGLKQYVISINGKLHVVSKKAMKDMIARRRFRKGTTIQDIERHALFVH